MDANAIPSPSPAWLTWFPTPRDQAWLQAVSQSAPSSPEASDLVKGLTRLERDLGQRADDETLADTLGDLSAALIAYLPTAGRQDCFIESDDGELIRVEPEEYWLGRLNELLASRGRRVKLRRAEPGQRFDFASMEATQSRTGNHMRVFSGQSWFVVRLTDGGPRVLQRARVITE